ncbi:O-antigen ligase family protein [Candidatus Omnitrophota bacterium]
MLNNLVLLYFIVYFLQLGGRISVLGALRFEFLIGVIILIAVCAQKHRLLLHKNKFSMAILFFFLALFASFLGAFWTHTASHAVEVFVNILKVFAMYIMLVGTIDDEKKFKRFLWVYLIMLLWVCLEPLCLYYTGNALVRKGHLYGATGLFAHYNALGSMSVITLIFLIQFMAYYKKAFIRILLLIFMGLVLNTLVLTASRTAYLGLISVGFFSVLFSKNRVRNFILVGLLGLVIFTMAPEEYRERFYSMAKMGKVLTGQTVEGDTIATRWQIIEDAWDIFLDYPIIGCGLDSFYQIRGARFNRWQQTHNLYMQIFTNVGVVGFLAFLNLISTIFRSCNNIKKAALQIEYGSKLMFFTSNTVVILMFTMLVIGIAAHILYSNVWWVMIALCLIMSRIQAQARRDN